MKLLYKVKRRFNQFIVKLSNNLSQNEGSDAPHEKVIFEGMPELIREAAAEGCVLLKNNGVLPLKDGGEVAVFGRVQNDWFYVGYGSGGDVRPPYKINLIQGLEESGKVKLNSGLKQTYEDWCSANPIDHGFWGQWPRFYPEMPLTDKIVNNATKTADTAIIVIGRAAGESRENVLKKGSFYLTNEETDMLEKVTNKFENTVLVLNIGNIIGFNFINKYKNISAVLITWQGGMESGRAAADVLTGKITPSGKLSATIATEYCDYPSKEFGNKKFNNYSEDIFVGYRYFETFHKDKVLYPFGFGLSYTEFRTEIKSAVKEENRIILRFSLENTGKYAGKEVLQIYVCPPVGKLGKSARNLAAFFKTETLAPKEKQDAEIILDINSFASYDDTGVTSFKSAYVLEEGDYILYAGSDVRNAEQVFKFEIERTYAVEQLTQISPMAKSFKKLSNIKNKEDYIATESQSIDRINSNLSKVIIENLPAAVQYTGDKGYKLGDVKDGKISLNDFVAQLNLTELEAITRGDYSMNSPLGPKGNTGTFGGVFPALRDKGIPPVVTTDGPSGIRLFQCTSLMPIGSLLASTWNIKLVEKLYALCGEELKSVGSDVLLAPGMNIQRNPLCGRNFEYFSEDPLLSGKMGGAVVKGIQSAGILACPKHFACNNQEYNRNKNDSRLTERALREIYLKGFEICVKESAPRTIMTSYNKINGVWGHYNYELCTTVLRGEWKYKGMVMTDWWMQSSKSPEFPKMQDQAYRIRAQVDLLMPGGKRNRKKKPDGTLLKTLGEPNGITLNEIQRSAKNILKTIMSSDAFNKEK